MGETEKIDNSRPIERKIYDALADLVARESLDKVTVSAICARAGVSRASFYSHFEDKYDVVERVEGKLADDLVGFARAFRSMNLRTCDDDAFCALFAEMYDWALHNGHYFASLTSPNGDLSFVDRVRKALRPYYAEFVRLNGVKGRYVEPVCEAISVMAEYRFLAYVSEQNPLPPEEMGSMSSRMVKALVEQFAG